MDKAHDVHSVEVEETHLSMVIDGRKYRLRWEDCSPLLAQASGTERRRFDVSPGGYGIHWPDLDEDLAISPLLERAEVVAEQAAG